MGARFANTAANIHRELARSESRRVIIPAICFKLAMLAVIVASAVFGPGLLNHEEFIKQTHSNGEQIPALTSHFEAWAARDILSIAADGYRCDQSARATWPLWPMLLRLCGIITRSPPLISAVVLTQILSVAAIFLLHHITRSRWGERTADFTCIFIMISPGAIFFHLPYSDSLVFFLTMLCFFSLQREFLAGVATSGFLLPLSDFAGVLIVVPILIELVQRSSRRGLYFLAACPLAGFMAYLGFFYSCCGDPWTGFSARCTQLREIGGSFPDFIAFLQNIKGPPHLGFVFSIIDRLSLAVFLILLLSSRRIPSSYLAYCLVTGLVPAVTDSLLSFARHMATLFPLFIVAARQDNPNCSNRLPVCTVSGLLITHLVFLIAETNYYWIG